MYRILSLIILLVLVGCGSGSRQVTTEQKQAVRRSHINETATQTVKDTYYTPKGDISHIRETETRYQAESGVSETIERETESEPEKSFWEKLQMRALNLIIGIIIIAVIVIGYRIYRGTQIFK